MTGRQRQLMQPQGLAHGVGFFLDRRVAVGQGGAEVGEQALVGNGSTLLDGARIGGGTLVAAGSVVTPGTRIPAGVVAAGVPCKVVKPIEGTSSQQWVEHNAAGYQQLAKHHATSAKRIETD